MMTKILQREKVPTAVAKAAEAAEAAAIEKRKKNLLLLKKKILMNQFPRTTEPPKSGIETIKKNKKINKKK